MFSTQNPPAVLPKMSTPKYEPKEGDPITIDLPNERTRGVIVSIISPTAVIARLTQYTTAFHSHKYKKDDLVACQHEDVGMNIWGWRALSERELAEAEAAAAPPEPEKKGKKGNAAAKG